MQFGLSTERERLKTALESEVPSNSNNNQNVVNLKNNFNQVLQQNTELKNRLLRIHEASDLTDLSVIDPVSENVSVTTRKLLFPRTRVPVCVLLVH